MILSNNLKKVLLVGASVLMFASVGAGSNQVMNANAKRRPVRVHRVVRRHSRKALRRYAHLKRAHAWNKKRNAHLKRAHALNAKRNSHKRNVHKYNVAKAKRNKKPAKATKASTPNNYKEMYFNLINKNKIAKYKHEMKYPYYRDLSKFTKEYHPSKSNLALYNRGYREGVNSIVVIADYEIDDDTGDNNIDKSDKYSYTDHLGNNFYYHKGWINGNADVQHQSASMYESRSCANIEYDKMHAGTTSQIHYLKGDDAADGDDPAVNPTASTLKYLHSTIQP